MRKRRSPSGSRPRDAFLARPSECHPTGNEFRESGGVVDLRADVRSLIYRPPRRKFSTCVEGLGAAGVEE